MHRFTAPALAEIREAARFYEGRVSGLAFEFLAELRGAIGRLRAPAAILAPQPRARRLTGQIDAMARGKA